VQLGQKLAKSVNVQACIASKWVQYALNLDATAVTADVVTPAQVGLDTSAFDLRELLVNVVLSPTFRYRPVEN
jgi:hypothetical protein